MTTKLTALLATTRETVRPELVQLQSFNVRQLTSVFQRCGSAMVTQTVLMDQMRKTAKTVNVLLTSLNVQTVDAFLSTGFVMKNLTVLMAAMRARRPHATHCRPAILAIQVISSEFSVKHVN